MTQSKKLEAIVEKECPITDAIVFIDRSAIRAVIRQELKGVGIGNIINAEEIQECLEQLAVHQRALLVIDWDHSTKNLNQILTKAQGHFGCDTRPIFLIASEVSLPLIATATEYFVSRIHTGEISRNAIQTHLEAMIEEEKDDEGLRNQLAQVAEARALGSLESAGKILADLMKKFPGNVRVGCEFVEHYIDLDKWEEASSLTDMLMAIDSNHLRIQHLKARILMHEGDFEKAAAILTKCKLINPFNIERLVDLGKAFMQGHKIREALAQFDEALQIDQYHKGANLGRAQCRLMEGDVNDALSLLRQMSSSRELASVFNNAAILAIRQGRFEHGLSLYRSAIGAVGKEHRITARLLYNLGIAQYKAQKMEEALECFEAASLQDKDFIFARQNAQALAHRLGRRVRSSVVLRSSNVNENFAEVFDEEHVSKGPK